jgi:hypothetical protein
VSAITIKLGPRAGRVECFIAWLEDADGSCPRPGANGKIDLSDRERLIDLIMKPILNDPAEDVQHGGVSS